MKKVKLTKLLASTLIIASVLALNPIAASAEWRQDTKGWLYTEGRSFARGWRSINGNLYFFKANGYMVDTTNNWYFDKEYGLNNNGQFSNVSIYGDWAFCKSTGTVVAYLGPDSNVNIPDKIDNIPVTGIGAFSFSSSKTESVTIPNTVTSIGICAFAGCTELTNIKIPNSVTKIYDSAFSDCRGLTNITIPSSVTKMGNSMFANCLSLTNVTVENGVPFLGYDAFTNCVKLTNITLPNNLTYIGEGTFQGCMSLKNIVIPNTVTNIENDAFNYCSSLTSLTLPEGLTKIGMGAFRNCTNLTSINIPNSVKSIETHRNGPNYTVQMAGLFEGSNNVSVYVKNEVTKQLLVNSGVSSSRIIVKA